VICFERSFSGRRGFHALERYTKAKRVIFYTYGGKLCKGMSPIAFGRWLEGGNEGSC